MKLPLYPDPVALFRLQAQVALMTMEAGAVIWMRMLGMGGVWNVTAGENTRMVSEKQRAFARAAQGAALAAMTGKDSTAAALRPIRQRTRANLRRLGKRGLKTP